MAPQPMPALAVGLSLLMLTFAADAQEWQAPAVSGRNLKQATPVVPLTPSPAVPPPVPPIPAPPVTPITPLAASPPLTPCQDIAPPPGTGGQSLSPSPMPPLTSNPAQNLIQAIEPTPAVNEVSQLLNLVGGRRLTQVQYSCAQQKAFGQCDAAFMQPQLGRSSYCAITCGRCTPTG